MAKPDKIDAAAEILNLNSELGEVAVDIYLHIFGGRLPVRQRDVANAVGEERLH